MKVLVVIAAVAAYFAVMVAVVPPLYLESYTSYPAPVHSVTVSDDVISLGESFRLRVDVVNDRDFADFVVTSVGFPDLEDAGAHVDLVGYDFDLPPRYVAAAARPARSMAPGLTVAPTRPSSRPAAMSGSGSSTTSRSPLPRRPRATLQCT